MNTPKIEHPVLFTIGHSDHEMAVFQSLLARHGVTAVADVRSQPYSRFHGQFNRELLAEALRKVGVQYVFMGNELGARRVERESYRGRQARYDLIAKLPAFQEGLTRLRKGSLTHRIALMCAEKDPLTCHRTILICRHLRASGLEIIHILEDGTAETHAEAESRLLELAAPPGALFCPREQLIEQAYDAQAEEIAFTESDDSAGNKEVIR